MKIATVDSACSILNENLMPTNILSMAGIVVDYPYEQPSQVQTRGEDYLVSDPNLLVNELKLCQEMLEIERVDSVHLDLSLGGINLLNLTEEDLLFRIPMSYDGREVLRLILPDLKRIATAIDEEHQIPVLAIGKRSGPVRLAELYAAAYGVARAMEKVKESGETIYVGLPLGATATMGGDREGEAPAEPETPAEPKVRIVSQIPMEKNLSAEAPVVAGVRMETFLNPIVRRFQALKLTPQETSGGSHESH
jgi:hypothetical protein